MIDKKPRLSIILNGEKLDAAQDWAGLFPVHRHFLRGGGVQLPAEAPLPRWVLRFRCGPLPLPASSSSSVPQPVQSSGEEGFRSLLSGLGFFPGERPEVKVPPVQKALSQGRGTLWLQDCSRLTQAGVVIY